MFKILITCSVVFLCSGCWQRSSESEDDRATIEAFAFTSDVIKRCVTEQAAHDGIEYVDELTGLWCDAPSISTPDLKYFKNLKRLSIYGIETYSGINPLDFSQIEQLGLYSVKFDGFEIHLLPNLTELRIEWARNFTQLDLSANTKLEDLYIEETPISDITFGHLPELRILFLHLGYTGHPRIEPTVDHIPFNEFPNLEEAKVWSFPLKELDVQNLNQLKKLWIMGGNFTQATVIGDALIELNIYVTKLQSFDVSHLPSLKSLLLNDNKISEINLDSASNLELIEIRSNPLTEETKQYLNSLPSRIEVKY